MFLKVLQLHFDPHPIQKCTFLYGPPCNSASEEAYGDAVEGFTRSKRDQNVQDAEVGMVEMNDEFMEKLDQEGEEFSKDELIELQNKLADEQKGLIGKREASNMWD